MTDDQIDPQAEFVPESMPGQHVDSNVQAPAMDMGELCDYRLYDKGEALFHEGDRGAEAYVIKSGSVSVTRTRANGEQEVGVVKAGSIVGEMAVISDMPRIATATALEETLCVALSRRAVQIMMARTDFETRTLIDFLIARVQEDAQGERVDKDELRRNNRILELLLNSPEQLEKLSKMEPFFVLLCNSLLERARKVLG